ncbi:SIMPL domain-containing protein, partial [Candidatus Woesearchaeota archaeon]|nr:SIMPL domain-containing protein [Candidatus Woesearchaeota archaeon]
MNNCKPLVWSGAVALGVLSLFLLVQTNHTLQTATTTNTVSFAGEGKVLAKPDVAIVNLTILTEAKTSKEAQDENSAKSNKLIEFLEGQGIDEKDVKTTGYNISPQYYYPPYPQRNENNTPRITGYRVNQTIQVKIRDLEMTDDVLD